MARLLVAGIGNIFRGDDAFGCEVARTLAAWPLPTGVRVKDFGIRGFDLACALVEGYDGAILIDAVSRGRPPGTLYLIEPKLIEGVAAVDPHGLTPDHVLQLATSLGELPPWLRILGCEPEWLGTEDDGAMGLSDTVRAVVEEAARMTEEIAREFLEHPVPNNGMEPIARI